MTARTDAENRISRAEKAHQIARIRVDRAIAILTNRIQALNDACEELEKANNELLNVYDEENEEHSCDG